MLHALWRRNNNSPATGSPSADYDNHGYEDLYVTAYGGNKLYHNNVGVPPSPAHTLRHRPLVPLTSKVAARQAVLPFDPVACTSRR
jgi:hypothetical protein